MNFDELQDDRATPQQSAPSEAPQLNFDELADDREQQAAPPASMSFDDLQDDRDGSQGAPEGEPTPSGEWTPVGSFGAGVAKGAVPTTGGLAAGLYAGAAATPFVGPIGGIIAGLGVGMGAGALLDYGQDKLLAAMGFDKPFQEAREQNPTAFDVGTMAPAAAMLRPGGTLVQRGAGALIGGGAEAGMELWHGEFDPKKIGMAAGMGAALPNANNLGSKVIASGEQLGERLSHGLWRGEGGRYRGGNKNPDLKEVQEEAPAPQEEDITVANDLTPTASGIAAENQPAPEITGAGNPEGAPMAAREGARPSDPERNYQKDQPQTQPDTTESKVIDTEPLKGDIKAALEAEHPPAGESEHVPRPEGTDVLPAREAAPTNPEPADVLPRPEPVAEAQPEAAARPEQAPEAAEPLTPAELRMLAEDRAILAKAGFDRALARLDELSPRQQLNAARQGANMMRQHFAAAETGVKPAEAEARRPDGELRKESRAKVSTGVLASSKADAARKEGAINTVKSIYDEFGPRSEKGKQIDPLDPEKTKDARVYAQKVWEETLKRNNGVDILLRGAGKSPENPNGQYVPLQKGEHDDAYQWLKAVKASAKGQNHRNFATLHSVEGMGKLDAETGRVEGDIRHRPQVEEKGAEAETAVGGMEQPRETFEHLQRDPRPGADHTYVDEHNKLADWLNDRSPREYEKLAEKYDLRAEMDEPADPGSLLSDMMQTLADTGKRPKGEITSEVDLPPKKVEAPALPQKEEPAPAGRKLDKNSDEFKRLAAQYNAQAAKEKPLSKAEQLALSEAKEKAATEAASRTEERTPIDATNPEAVWKGITESLARAEDIVADAKQKYGAGDLEMRRRGLMATVARDLWQRFRSPFNPSSPAANQGVIDYAESLSKKFWQRAADTKTTKLEIAANLARAASVKLTPYEHRKIAIAEQDNKIGSLPQKLRDYYSEHVAPVRDKAMQVMRDFKDLNDSEKLGYELPNLNAVTTKAYQPRYQIDKQAFNRKDTEAFDPFTGQGLGDYSPNLEDRSFFAVENGNQRMVIEVTKDPGSGDVAVNIHRGPNSVVKLKNLPPGFEGKIGQEIPLSVKGQKGKWTVDQATTKEIEKATGTKYYENAVWAWSKMLDDMTRAYENAKLTTEIKNDPEFQKLTTTDRTVAQANGWSSKITTHLPDFATRNGKNVYMPDNLRWVFDDYHKPGFGGLTSEGIEKLRNFNVALLKVFNTNAPLVHVLNELDLFTVGRGFKWISPKAYYDLAVSAPTAFKSVNAQDKLQAEMRRAGVNPMLASVSLRTMYETAAKNFGMEIMRDHSKWDPVARAWGVSTKEVGNKLYDLSSDVTWRLSDYLTTMRYLEEKRAGFGPEEAAKRVNKFMSDYHIGTTVMGSRALQQLLTEPAVTAFGRYKAGIFRSMAHMTRDLLSPKATKSERLEALGQWLVMGALGYVVYPAADALVRKVTDNEGGELRRRGITSIADAAKNIVTGEKDPSAMLTRAWTPAPALNAGIEIAKNKDFAGKPIMPQGEWPGVLPDTAASLGEYGARTLIPPYGTISQHYARPEATPGGVLGSLAWDQVGVGLPSDAGIKRQGRIERINAQTAKARQKHPNGVIPDLMNRLTD